MSLRRRKLNIALLVTAVILGGLAAWRTGRPPLVLSPASSGVKAEWRSRAGFPEKNPSIEVSDVISGGGFGDGSAEGAGITGAAAPRCSTTTADSPTTGNGNGTADGSATGKGATDDNAGSGSIAEGGRGSKGTRIGDVDVRRLIGGNGAVSSDWASGEGQGTAAAGTHPFAKEALKVLRGGADEADSVSRHRILSYCEHLRTAYTTRDIDFIRQVFSNDALIIVGHMVRPDAGSSRAGGHSGGVTGDAKVRYSVRSKREYLERLMLLFNSGKEIDVRFSDFRIMRHPTLAGIYGVTLRQGYKAGGYEDDGWLFLLWDFRDRSMPLIHVRTWQPAKSVAEGEDVIDISDFNLD